jgi:hypothetical protein
MINFPSNQIKLLLSEVNVNLRKQYPKENK